MTTVELTKTTRDKLRGIGRKGETYDTLILMLLELCDRKCYE